MHLKPIYRRTLLLLGLLAAVYLFSSLPYSKQIMSDIFGPGAFCNGHTAECTLVTATLNVLPRDCGKYLRSITVQYNESQLAGFTDTYGNMTLTGGLPDNEFRAVVIHECGHVTDFFALHGTPRLTTSAFTVRTLPTFVDDPSLQFYALSWVNPTTKKAAAKDEDFVSSYAAQDCMEDFAETYAYFVLQRSAFEKRAKTNKILKNKYDFMKRLLPSKFDVSTGSRWDGTIPTIVTGMEYDWHPYLKAAAPQRKK